MDLSTFDLPVTAYREPPPSGPAQLEALSFEVKDAAAVGLSGTASVTFNLAEKISGPSGLSYLRVAIAIPKAEIGSTSTSPPLGSPAQVLDGSEVVWRVAKLLPSSPGPIYTFTVSFTPLVEGTLRIAFTGRAAELAGTREFVCDHTVAGAAQP